MVSIAKLLTLHCPLIYLNNIAVLNEDASLAAGLPMIVFDRSITNINNMKIDAGLIHYTCFICTLMKVDLYRSLDGWMEDSVLILLAENEPRPELWKLLWLKGFYNILKITISGDIYSYNPFNDKLYPDCYMERMWHDLNGWPIKISAFQHPLGYSELSVGSGIDASFMYEFSHHLNFTPIIINTNNYDEAIFQMLIKTIEMSVNALTMRFYNEKLIMSHAMYTDEKCVAVKKGEILRGWEVFVHTFHWDVWLAIFCASLITNWAIATVSKQRNWHESMPLTLKAMFTIPLRRPPKCSKERLIIGACLIFGIVIVTTYQASLYHFIKSKVKHKPPATLADITLEIRGRHFPNETALTNRMFDKYAIRLRRKIYELLIQTGQLSNLYLVPQCLYTANFVYPLRKGSIWLAPLNRFVLSMLEAGFPEAWYRRTVFTKERISYKKKRKIVDSIRALTLRDVEVAFFAFLIGLSLSLLAFLIEILSATIASKQWLHKRQLNTRQFLH